MTKIENAGAAPVSKYAAKKLAYAKANAEEAAKANAIKEPSVDLSANDNKVVDNGFDTDGLTQGVGEMPSKVANKKGKTNGIPPVANRYPEHVVQIALLIKNNAEIRRFTALGILNYLLQKREINGNSRYVSFKWNKFAVKANGLMREYSYNEPFFLNALVAAFSSFSASAQRTIDHFCKQEMSVGIAKAVDQNAVNDIVELNEQYQDSKENVSDVADVSED